MLGKTEALMAGIRALLREELEAQGRSVRSLAAAAEASQPCLNRFLNGDHDTMRASTLFSLALALGKSPAWLVREGAKRARAGV